VSHPTFHSPDEARTVYRQVNLSKEKEPLGKVEVLRVFPESRVCRQRMMKQDLQYV
jgi:hypothetical protein